MSRDAARVALLGRRVLGTGVESFRFERPEGWGFLPGQYLMLGLDVTEPPSAKPFTVCSAPGDPYLEVATRLTGSPFKTALDSLPVGGVAGITGPLGRAILPEGACKAAFLVGGVGVTPARSVVRDAVQRGSGLQAVVFHGNQTADCVPYADEIAGYAADGRAVSLVTVLAVPPAGWAGEAGFITADVVRRHLEPADGWHFVVSGPPAMVDAMEGVLDGLEVPAERRTIERFAGYR